MVWEGQCAAGEAAKLQLRQVQSRLGAEQEHTVELEGELEALLNHVQQVPPILSILSILFMLSILSMLSILVLHHPSGVCSATDCSLCLFTLAAAALHCCCLMLQLLSIGAA